MRQAGGELDLTLEAGNHLFARPRRLEQLYGAGTLEHEAERAARDDERAERDARAQRAGEPRDNNDGPSYGRTALTMGSERRRAAARRRRRAARSRAPGAGDARRRRAGSPARPRAAPCRGPRAGPRRAPSAPPRAPRAAT